MTNVMSTQMKGKRRTAAWRPESPRENWKYSGMKYTGMKRAVPAAADAMYRRTIVRDLRKEMGKRRFVGVVKIEKYCWMEKRMRTTKHATKVPIVRPSLQAQVVPLNVNAMTNET